jgi:hypothetical protein
MTEWWSAGNGFRHSRVSPAAAGYGSRGLRQTRVEEAAMTADAVSDPIARILRPGEGCSARTFGSCPTHM